MCFRVPYSRRKAPLLLGKNQFVMAVSAQFSRGSRKRDPVRERRCAPIRKGFIFLALLKVIFAPA